MTTPEFPEQVMATNRKEMEILVEAGLARLNLIRDIIFLPVEQIVAIEKF